MFIRSIRPAPCRPSRRRTRQWVWLWPATRRKRAADGKVFWRRQGRGERLQGGAGLTWPERPKSITRKTATARPADLHENQDANGFGFPHVG